MRLKTFEEFDQQPRQYVFYVINPGVDFEAEVRDTDGKVIYRVDKKKMEKGVMSNVTDLSSLRDYLVRRKKIRQFDELTPAETVSNETLPQLRPNETVKR
jgi:hypothetical protein